MLPPRIATVFKHVPNELIELCRSHPWPDLITPPGLGMRSIRDVLLHLVDVESFWVGQVIHGRPVTKLEPAAFDDLDKILAIWTPRREATVSWQAGLGPKEQASTKRLPWDPNQNATVAEIVWHVVAHEQYHRGQIFTRLALLGRRDLPDYDFLRRVPVR
jgi:uncharacterized damage-inducible protein DinB